MKSQRKFVNLLLQPFVQMRLAAYNLALSSIYVVALGFYAYAKLGQFTEAVATLTDADTEMLTMLDAYVGRVAAIAALSGLAFVVINLALSIWVTHRLVGPTVAFRRHIRSLAAGDYAAKTKLRKYDAFTEVADDLNQLSDTLAGAKRP